MMGRFASAGRFNGNLEPLSGKIAKLAAIQKTIAICTLRSRSKRVNQDPAGTELGIGMHP